MILVGIDDTDIVDHPGTNQLARHIAYSLDGDFECHMIVRHQLLFDPRIPYTSKNGSASIWLVPRGRVPMAFLINRLRTLITEWCPGGSDPGFCVAEDVPDDVVAFGRRCQQHIVSQAEAHALAKQHEIHLEGIAGTQGGVIGALAAVGLATMKDSGRIIRIGHAKRDLHEVSGRMPIAELSDFGIQTAMEPRVEKTVTVGQVDVGKRLRPNWHRGQVVLFVEPATQTWCEQPCWQALKVV